MFCFNIGRRNKFSDFLFIKLKFMKICAIISEFNPFHSGHKYLVDKATELGYTHKIAIMSGNFVQRGEPAIISKGARARAAMKNGINLVIEIPSVWAISTSERYARAGVMIADSLRCVESLIFGSESGNLKALQAIAGVLDTPDFSNFLKKFSETGITFAKAREKAVQEILKNLDASAYMHSANDNLAIEYIRNLNKINSKIAPISVKRTAGENIISASEIRDLIYSGSDFQNYLPRNSEEILYNEIKNNLAPANAKNAEKIILYRLKCLSKDEFKTLPDVSEGLENRFIKVINNSENIEKILLEIKTKRYTMSRIKRIIMAAVLDIKNEIQKEDVPYIRVLGADEKGIEILKKSKNFSLPTITKYSDTKNLSAFGARIFEKECFCTSIYGLFLENVKNFPPEQQFKLIRG